MITKLTIHNFKQFGDVTIDLAETVVFIGPNNSGKTTALQALALWDVGYKQWITKRGPQASALKKSGVAINRRDLISLPVPSAKLLWRNLHVRSVSRKEGKQRTSNIRIDIIVEGISTGKMWKCGLEFDYANEESFHCRPMRTAEGKNPPRMEIPELPGSLSLAFLPPMSGLADREFIKQPGEIGVLLGQGQTAEILRNLCYRISSGKTPDKWSEFAEHIQNLFGVRLREPVFIPETSEITLSYEHRNNIFDLSCSGRGMQQVMLLLAHLYTNPGSVLLLDEPDAHLEVLRQRQVFNLLTDVARKQNSQIIAASHSEVVLNEAVGRHSVTAFVGKPHLLVDRGSQVLKALKDLGFDQYSQAEQKGWVLYVEDATDLAILQAFAKKLDHPAAAQLDKPFVHYVGNLPQKAREHFYGLREAMPALVGIAVFDRLDKVLDAASTLVEAMWKRCEIENYFCTENVLLCYAGGDDPVDLFVHAERNRRTAAMRAAIAEVKKALVTFDKPSPWSSDIKASDDVLAPIMKAFSKELDLPLVLRKNQYCDLVQYVEAKELDSEVTAILDKIMDVANKAQPGGSE